VDEASVTTAAGVMGPGVMVASVGADAGAWRLTSAATVGSAAPATTGAAGAGGFAGAAGDGRGAAGVARWRSCAVSSAIFGI